MISVSKSFRWFKLLPFLILGILSYSNTLEVPFYFDDEQNIVKNPLIRLTSLTFDHITKAALQSYASNRPVANVSFALNYYFHQYDVIGYHAVNITIHVLTGILLYLLIRMTLRTPALGSWHRSHYWIALFAALLWLVHPIQTQSVTYIVQRMNSMSAMFYVLSFLCYVKGRLVKNNQRSWPWFSGCAVAGILALGSKEIAATLPFFIFLYEWYFFQDLNKAWLKRHLPYIVGTLIFLGLLACLYLGTNPLRDVLSGYKHRDFTLTQRVLTEFRVVIHYISLLVYPHPSRLNLDYDFPLSYSLLRPMTTLFSMAAIVALIGLAVYLAKKERLISFCILWFFGNLAIESSVIALEIVYEHRTYLPSMLFFLPILSLTYRYIRSDWVVIGLVSATVLLFCLWTHERNSLWGDRVALWRDCVNKSGNKARPHNNLGLALAEQRRFEEAIVHYTEALRLYPDYARAHNNSGLALAEQRRFEEAIVHYAEALRITPDFAEAHNNMGSALAGQGKLQEAIAHYAEALRIYPDYAKAYNNLGNALAMQGKLQEAIAHYAKALRMDPDYASAHNNWGNALAVQGELQEAVAHYAEALRIDPDYVKARNNLTRALRRVDKSEMASHTSKDQWD
jgi:tetratricopeptide (TPR) repeat protein